MGLLQESSTRARAKLPWLVATLVFALGACGGPSHDGYRSSKQKPWKKPQILTFDEDGEAEHDGAVNYAKRKRAEWLAVDLPGPGTLKLRMMIIPADEHKRDTDLAFEVLDSSYRVIERADADEDDAGDLDKRRTLDELSAGRYYIHVYAQERTQRADFSIRAIYTPGKGEYQSDFPEQVAYVGVLPAVPVADDSPPPPPAPPAPKATSKAKRTPKRLAIEVIRGRISGITTTAKGTRIKIDRGTAQGVAKGWRGAVVTKNGTAIQNGAFVVEKTSSYESHALVRATQDAVTSAKYVRLRPP